MKVIEGIDLDPDYVGGGTLGLLAKKGAGKTYGMRDMAEEFWKAEVPFVALDPMDAFWGLRSNAKGTGEGIPVPIFGGEHADVPLEPTGGKLMADLVIEEGLSCVLSLSEFGSRAKERKFALDFLERLYRKNKNLVHILMDEADLFAPQKPQQGDQPLLGVTENIVRRGRNKGIGITMATQRPAVLNKDVLTQVDGLIVMRMLGPNDRNAINDWVGEHGEEGLGKTVKGTLPDLDTGECWVWVPELQVFGRSKFRKSRTFDSSPTRKRSDAKKKQPKGYAEVDLAGITTRMQDTIERAKKEDPKELQKRVRELEAELAKRPEAEPEIVTVEKPVFPAELKKGLIDSLEKIGKDLERGLETVGNQIEHVQADHDVDVAVEPRKPARAIPPARPPARASGGATVATPKPASQPVEWDGQPLKLAERKVLNVLAQYPEGRTQKQVAIQTGYSGKSGGFKNAIGSLRSKGLITPARVDPIQITEEGIEAAGEIEPLPTGQALLDHWLGQLKKAERAILQVVWEANGSPLDAETIAANTDPVYSPTSGGFKNAMGKLRTLELIEGYGSDIVASETLYD